MKNNFFSLFTYMRKSLLSYLIGIVCAGLLSLLLQLLISTMFLHMFNSLEARDLNRMLYVVIMYNIFIVLIFGITPFFNFLVRKQSAVTIGTIQSTLFNKLKKLPISFFKKNHSGELISHLTNDVSEMEKAYTQYITRFLENLFLGVGTVIYSFILEWRLALFALVGGLLILLVNLFYSRILSVVNQQVLERLGNLTARLTNIIDGIHVIKMFNIYNLILGKYKSENERVYAKSKEKVNKESFIAAINSFVEIFSFTGIIILGTVFVLNGLTTTGIIIAIVQLQNGIRNLIGSMGSFITNIQSSIAANKRISAILNEEEEKSQSILMGELTNEEAYAVVFKNVKFGYDDKLILDDLSFKLPRGKVYALVGPSGGGKTTIVKLIMKFFEVKSGQVYIEGKINYKETNKQIRSLISYVPQDAFMFTGTILENIRYGKLDATFEEIKEAATLALANDFIEKLPDGYNTFVGENGAQLSGGERQRIAIARAILKNAPLLLLDEATSALDSESEELVQKALERLMKDKSTLIVAHRLSTVKKADKILVIKDGTVVENGTHNELLQDKNGVYTSLYMKQFRTENAS